MKQALIQLRATLDEKARWEAEAKNHGISLSEWIRNACNADLNNNHMPDYRHLGDIEEAPVVRADDDTALPETLDHTEKEIALSQCHECQRKGVSPAYPCDRCRQLRQPLSASETA